MGYLDDADVRRCSIGEAVADWVELLHVQPPEAVAPELIPLTRRLTVTNNLYFVSQVHNQIPTQNSMEGLK